MEFNPNQNNSECDKYSEEKLIKNVESILLTDIPSSSRSIAEYINPEIVDNQSIHIQEELGEPSSDESESGTVLKDSDSSENKFNFKSDAESSKQFVNQTFVADNESDLNQSQLNTSAKKRRVRRRKRISKNTLEDKSILKPDTMAQHTVKKYEQNNTKKISFNHTDVLQLQALYLQASGCAVVTEPIANTSTHKKTNNPVNRYTPNKTLTPNTKAKSGEYSKSSTDSKSGYEKYASEEEIQKGLAGGTMIEGSLRINARCYQQAYVSHPDKITQDIIINGVKDRNRGLEDDVVIIEILNKNETGQLTGKVVSIKERRNTQTCVGYLKLATNNKNQVVLYPRDKRFPVLSIPLIDCPPAFQQLHKVYEDTLFSAKIVTWCNPRYTIGTLLSKVGQAQDMKTQTQAIILENDLDVSPYEIAWTSDLNIPDEEFTYREDFRKQCIFTIDPLTARDLDDSVSCRLLDNGNYEIGVHISDVTYYLKEGTTFDEKASKKATTIYLVDGTYHMLPKELCFCCSLLPGSDKLTFSVIWEFTEQGDIVNHRFTRSIINSCCQLAYEHVQQMLDDPEKPLIEEDFPSVVGQWSMNDIKDVVLKLHKFSTFLRSKRYESGALRIDQPKLRFSLNPKDGLPQSYQIEEHNESHALIEEYMLLANCTVAERIFTDYPRIAFLRLHPPPKNSLDAVAQNFRELGIDLDITSAGQLHNSLLKATGDAKADKAKSMVLHSHLIKTLSRAIYFCSNGYDEDDIRHYALNIPLYTHFTSPIRRYADVMVHRLLASTLGYSPTPMWNPDFVKKVADNCNKQKYNAKRAGDMSAEMYLYKYISMNAPVVEEAAVMEIFENSMDVVIFAMGIIRRIYFDNFSDDAETEISRKKNMDGEMGVIINVKWKGTPDMIQTLRIFDVVQVKFKEIDSFLNTQLRMVKPSTATSCPDNK